MNTNRQTQEEKDLETRLQRYEETLELSEKLANMGNWDYDLVNHTTTWSRNLYLIYGLEPYSVKITNQLFRSRIYPEDLARYDQAEKDLMDHQLEVAIEFRIVMPDGSLKWILDDIFPFFEDGGLVRLKGINIDVTEKRMAEQALKDLNATLELRIEERTMELAKTNEHLLKEMNERLLVENSLRIKSSELERFFDVSLDLLCIADLEGRILEVNKSWETIFGLSTMELKGRYYLDFVHPDDKVKTLEKLKLIKINQSIVNYVNRNRVKDGSYRYIEWKAKLNENLIYAAARDVTDRIESDLLLEQSKQNIETFFNTIDDFLYVLDKNGKLIYFNQALPDRLGYTFEDMMGKNPFQFFPGMSEEMATQIFFRLLKSKKNYNNLPFITKKGVRIPVDTRIKQGYWNGEPAIFGVSKDISQIQLSEKKFSTAFQSNSAMMSISSIDEEKYLDVNNAFLEVLGYRKEEVIGKSAKDLKLLDNLVQRSDLLSRVGKGESIQKVEMQMRSKDGSVKTGLLSAAPIQIDDKRCLLSVTLDISERKEAENELKQARLEAERANQAKSEFLSRMSHELRTPMNAILGFAQLMQLGELNSAQRKGIQHILNSGRHLLELINEVLDISRIESGSISLSLEPVVLESILKEVIDTVLPIAKKFDIQIRHVKSHILTHAVKADKQRLTQILLNLLANAIKYNRKGGSVVVDAIDSPAHPDRIRIRVADTGPGIVPEDQNRLFVPFERLGAEKTNIEGTGLGLSVVKKLVEALQGTVGVESIPGQGSTFWFDLPKCEEVIKMVYSESAYNQPETSSKSGVILYIEDNYSNVELVQSILQFKHPEIKLITSPYGKKAVALIQKNQPDLILLDLNLPDINGQEVLEHIRKKDSLREIPVIVVTADAMPHQKELLLKAGAVDFLVKPLDIRLFLKSIETYL